MANTYLWLISFLAAGLIACRPGEKPQETREQELKISETDHSRDQLLKTDTLLNGREPLTFSLEKIEGSFVLSEQRNASGVEMHLYPDRFLKVQFKNKTYELRKDSLLKEVNKEFLDEALIGNVLLDYYNSENGELQFSFEVKKPGEDFRFPFKWVISENKYLIELIDE